MRGGEKKKGLRNAFPSYITSASSTGRCLCYLCVRVCVCLCARIVIILSVNAGMFERKMLNDALKAKKKELCCGPDQTDNCMYKTNDDKWLKALRSAVHLSRSPFLLFTHCCIIWLGAKDFFYPRRTFLDNTWGNAFNVFFSFLHLSHFILLVTTAKLWALINKKGLLAFKKLSLNCGIPQVCQQTLNFMFWSEVKTCYLNVNLEDDSACWGLFVLQVLGQTRSGQGGECTKSSAWSLFKHRINKS